MRELGEDTVQRDYKTKPLTKDEVAHIVDVVGDVAPLVNTRHEVAKANDWKTRPPSKKAFVEAVVKDVNVLRRPVLIVGKDVVIGKDDLRYRELLGA